MPSLSMIPWGAWKWEFEGLTLKEAKRLCRRASRRYGKRFAAEEWDGVIWGFTVLEPAVYDWSKDRVITVGTRESMEKLAQRHNRQLMRVGREWHLLKKEELEDIEKYPWDTVEVGDDFRLSLACEKWRAKMMVKRHSKRGKKFVLYYGVTPVRHLRVRRVT